MMNGLGGMMGGGLGATLLLFWIPLLAVVVWAVTRVFPPSAGAGPRSAAGDDPAIEALRVRYGRGEIDAEEYLHALGVLQSKPSAPEKELPVR